MSFTPSTSPQMEAEMTPVQRFQQQQMNLQHLRLPRAAAGAEGMEPTETTGLMSGAGSSMTAYHTLAGSSLTKNPITGKGARDRDAPSSNVSFAGNPSIVSNVTYKNDHIFIHPADRDIRHPCNHRWLIALFCGTTLFLVLYMTFMSNTPDFATDCDEKALGFGMFLGSHRSVYSYSNCRTTYVSREERLLPFDTFHVSTGYKWRAMEYVQRYLLEATLPGVYLSPNPPPKPNGNGPRYESLPFGSAASSARGKANSVTNHLNIMTPKELWELKEITVMNKKKTTEPVQRFINGASPLAEKNSEGQSNVPSFKPRAGDVLVYLHIVPAEKRGRFNLSASKQREVKNNNVSKLEKDTQKGIDNHGNVSATKNNRNTAAPPKQRESKTAPADRNNHNQKQGPENNNNDNNNNNNHNNNTNNDHHNESASEMEQSNKAGPPPPAPPQTHITVNEQEITIVVDTFVFVGGNGNENGNENDSEEEEVEVEEHHQTTVFTHNESFDVHCADSCDDGPNETEGAEDSDSSDLPDAYVEKEKSSVAPANETIVIEGHVAVIVQVDDNFVYVAEQNFDNRAWELPYRNYSRRIPIKHNAQTLAYTIDDSINGKVEGWMRFRS